MKHSWGELVLEFDVPGNACVKVSETEQKGFQSFVSDVIVSQDPFAVMPRCFLLKSEQHCSPIIPRHHLLKLG